MSDVVWVDHEECAVLYHMKDAFEDVRPACVVAEVAKLARVDEFDE
jgi:hypothetical protein